MSGGKVGGAIRSLVNAKGLQFDCSRVLHELLFIPLLLYDSEAMVWRERKRSRIKVVQMDSLRGLVGIRRMNIVPNKRIRELCRVS